MPNVQSPRHAQTLIPVSSSGLLESGVLDRLYAGRERALRPAKSSPPLPPPKVAGPDAIWGQYNNYRSNGVAMSAVIHICVLGLILATATLGHQVIAKAPVHETVTLIAPSLDSYALPVAKKVVSGGGGGGDRSPIEAPKGRLPKLATEQITPPQIVLRDEHPKLTAEPTVVMPPQVHVAENHMLNLGIPTAAPLPSAPPSNGTGSGAGIGSGSGGGVGVGHGAGVGVGSGGGIGGGIYKVGGGISAPQAISTPDPEYTQEARNAKTQGTCILWLIVDDQGRPRDIRVVHGLGFGLDAKAIDAVEQWRFQPAMKDGHPVNVQISVEVGFKLY